MKLLNIKNVNNNVLTCLENPIVTAMNYFQRDPTMMFGASWSFSYNFMKEFNGVESSKDIMRLIRNMEKFTNVKLNIKKALDFESVKKEVIFELDSNRPVIVYMDSSWCPWLTSYNNSLNTHHYVLIIGIDIQKKEFHCLESSNEDIKILPFDDYIEGKNEYIVFNIGPVVDFNRHDFLVNIINNIAEVDGVMENSSVHYNINHFSKQLANKNFDIKEEIDGYNPFKYAPIFSWLRGICKSRIKFTYALDYLEQYYNNNNIYHHKQMIVDLEVKWRQIVIKLLRAVYSKKPELIYISIAKNLQEIADSELRILKSLKQELISMS